MVNNKLLWQNWWFQNYTDAITCLLITILYTSKPQRLWRICSNFRNWNSLAPSVTYLNRIITGLLVTQVIWWVPHLKHDLITLPSNIVLDKVRVAQSLFVMMYNMYTFGCILFFPFSFEHTAWCKDDNILVKQLSQNTAL